MSRRDQIRMTDEEVREAMVRFLGVIGAKAGEIEKRIGEGPSFSLQGDLKRPAARIQTEIARLLENFDEASILLAGEEVRYTLAAYSG